MKKPIIGISAGVLTDEGGMFPGYRRTYVNEDYITSVIKNGGIPLIIPMNNNLDVIKQQLEFIDGLLLTGGNDISPLKYNQEPEQKLGDLLPERDEFEFELLKLAKVREIPILGICRGCQLINVFHGGTLYQDLSYRKEKTLRHWQSHNPSQVTHSIKIKEDTKLSEMLKQEKILVNSFHHQIIKDIPRGFIPCAIAPDGVIEGIESTQYKFLLGLQWHPEMLHDSVECMNLIFKSFINISNGE